MNLGIAEKGQPLTGLNLQKHFPIVASPEEAIYFHGNICIRKNQT
jgi:hypothetical protein